MTASNRICSIEACNTKQHSRGWCRTHYGRWWKFGDPEKAVQKQAKKGECQKYFFQAIKNPAPDRCIIWPYGKTGGLRPYGAIGYRGKPWTTHRLALCIYTNTWPGADILACHGPCHNPLCFNPLHLSWGTRTDNNRDQDRDGTRARGEAMPVSKLTEKGVREIRASSRTQKDLAKMYGVSAPSISMARSRKTWAHVTD